MFLITLENAVIASNICHVMISNFAACSTLLRKKKMFKISKYWFFLGGEFGDKVSIIRLNSLFGVL